MSRPYQKRELMRVVRERGWSVTEDRKHTHVTSPEGHKFSLPRPLPDQLKGFAAYRLRKELDA